MTRVLTFVFVSLVVACLALQTYAQTTEFTYQGSLKNSGTAASGNFDFEFALFDAVSGGAQLGSTLTRGTVAVANGVFTVKLDFGSQFPGANRFLEIRVRQTGQPSFTPLTPRQLVNSAPYSVKSLNADTVGGTTASGFIQNGTTLQTANQNISGNAFFGGQVGIGTTNAGASTPKLTVLGSGSVDAISGLSPSGAGVTGSSTSSYGVHGLSDSSIGVFGDSNSYIGVYGRSQNNVGVYGQSTNGLAGDFAGRVNISGQVGIGTANPTANVKLDVDGGSNVGIFGRSTAATGVAGSSGSGNGVSGVSQSASGVTGFSTTGAGLRGDSDSGDGVYGTSSSGKGVEGFSFNSTGLYGSSANGRGVEGTGIGGIGVYGTSASSSGVQGVSTSGIGLYGVSSAVGSTLAAIRGVNTASGGNGIIGEAGGGTGTGVYGVSTSATGYGVIGRNLSGGYAGYFDGNLLAGAFLDINQYTSGGTISVCRNGGRLAACSSSLRYKTNIGRFDQGLSLLNKLQPITFDWKSNGLHDLGFGAEDVEKAEPLLVSYNDKGQVEGVKYDRISVVLVNAIKEQQTQIEAQAKQIAEQKDIAAKQQALIEQLAKRLEELEKKEAK